MIALHTRALCDECGVNPAVVQIDETFFLCERCDASINGAVEDSVTSVIPLSGVSAATDVSSAPNPGTVAAINSNSPPLHSARGILGPSLATGMSSDPANAGGDNEAVTALALNDIDAPEAFETTSLTANGANLDTQRTGTAPGASGPECDLIGAPNSSSGDGLGILEPGSITSGDRIAVTAGSGRARNRAICPAVTGAHSNPETPSLVPVNCGAVSLVEAAPLSLSARWASGGVIAAGDFGLMGETCRDFAEVAPLSLLANTPEASGTARKAPSGSLFGEPSRILDRAPLSLAVDPDLEAAISALEVEWLRAGIIMNAMTLRVTAASDNISKSSVSEA